MKPTNNLKFSTAWRAPFRFMSGTLRGAALVALICGPLAPVRGQDRLPGMPGYDRYSSFGRRVGSVFSAVQEGVVRAEWMDGGRTLEYTRNGKHYRYDVTTRKATEIAKRTPTDTEGRGRGRFGGGPERGRQYTFAVSPDGKRRAFYKENNVWLGDGEGNNAEQITSDGSKEKRIKNGSASWVYGEELSQTTALWWSSDNTKLAFYRFDEAQVKDYYLTLDHLKQQTSLDAEPYPKAGAPNPIVDILFYDVKTKQTVKADLRDGKPFTDDVVGHYAYRVSWSPDGKELLYCRANRKQNVVEFMACDPATGKSRVIVHEENPNGWVNGWPDALPLVRFLGDGKRFLLTSERNGFRNLYLYDLSGRLLNTVTGHNFEVEDILRVDEKAGTVFYTAHSGDNPHKMQLHRVKLDGTSGVRLTDPTLHHDVNLAPDGKSFLDIAQAHATPPSTRLVDENGKIVATLATADAAKVAATGFVPAELFTFKAGDGKTDLYGVLHKPSDFDPSKKYPLLVSVYAGPETTGAGERYATPSALTEMGFLVASLDARGGSGRGRAFKDMMYGRMGIVEIDDQAAGVKALRERPYVDGGRVGIFGTSYGGYASAMALLRHPDVFSAASASSAVTDWKNYDSTYTERYMGLPGENKAGYEAGSTMTYAKNLRGRLMLYFGSADNNVHPANTLQLIQALQRAGKSFEVQVGPDQGHTGLNTARMLEFFMDALVLRPAGTSTATAPSSR